MCIRACSRLRSSLYSGHDTPAASRSNLSTHRVLLCPLVCVSVCVRLLGETPKRGGGGGGGRAEGHVG